MAQVAAAALPGRTGSCPARACLPARVRSFSSSGAALTSRQRTAIIIAHRLAQRRCRTMTWGAAASRPQPQRLLPASEAVVCIPTRHCGNSDRLYQSLEAALARYSTSRLLIIINRQGFVMTITAPGSNTYYSYSLFWNLLTRDNNPINRVLTASQPPPTCR